MYIIKLINVLDKEYVSSKYVDCTSKSIKPALEMLESAIRSHVKEEMGRDGLNGFKIIDVHTLDQVATPTVDGLTCYRLSDDPHRVFLYRRKTSIVKQPNWTWGETEVPIVSHQRVAIFELEECESMFDTLHTMRNPRPELEMVTVGKSDLRIPKMLTQAPMCDVITELKNNPVFLARRQCDE